MRAEIVSIKDIPADLIVKWNEWAAPRGELLSPYMRFEFAETVSLYRRDTRVAVLEDDSGVVGFFPHHVPHQGVVRPIGAPMSDYQGVIAGDYSNLSLSGIVRSTGASALVFDNWYCPHGGHAPSRRGREGSVIADLRAGSDAYFAAQKAAFKDHFKKTARRARAAERDFGEVRVTLGDADGSVFKALSDWKQRQYRETGKLNVFGIDWVRSVLDNLRRREGQEFGGLTAALWFGDRLAAVEFGLCAGDVYHSWFPAYDPELAKYSPGLLLLHGIFEQIEGFGRQRVDLGRGGAHYKKYYASYEVPLDQGRFLRPGLATLGIRGWEMTEAVAQHLPNGVANLPSRMRRRWAQVSAFEPRLAPRVANLVGSFSL